MSCLSSPLGISTLSDTLHPYKVRHHSLQCHLIPTMEENENPSSRKTPINPAAAPRQPAVRRQVFSSALNCELWCKRCVEAVARYSSWLALDSLSVGSSHYYKMPSIIPPNININLLFRDENVRQIRSFLCKCRRFLSLSRLDTKSLGNSFHPEDAFSIKIFDTAM